MKKIDLTINNCSKCPFANYYENGEYPNAGQHCQHGELYDNIEKNGFKGTYEDDECYIPEKYDDGIDEETYIHPNCPLPDIK